MSTEPAIIVFDGVCVLCNGWVRFLLARDPNAQFRFAAMQSEAGRGLLARHGLNPDDPASFLLLEGDRAFTDTRAIARVLRRLPGAWPWIGHWLAMAPRALVDPLYRLVARNRYRWFGRHASCLLPTPGQRERFIGTH